jgi:hypothetical protein
VQERSLGPGQLVDVQVLLSAVARKSPARSPCLLYVGQTRSLKPSTFRSDILLSSSATPAPRWTASPGQITTESTGMLEALRLDAQRPATIWRAKGTKSAVEQLH